MTLVNGRTSKTNFEPVDHPRQWSGLLAEEVEPRSGELLGNLPQAFNHIGLVSAAWAIAEAEQRASGH